MVLIKPKPCKICRDLFTPFKSTDPVCAKYECRVRFAEEYVRKSQEKRLKAQRKEVREKILATKPKSYWIKKLQPIFNKYIRLRDRDLPCISCERENIPEQIGGAWDCGHFLSVGSHPHLRFVEDNAHKQCKTCNGGSGKYTRKNYLVSQAYEENIVKRIGQERVDAVLRDNEARHYTIDDIKQLIAEYKAKIKEMGA